MSTPMVYGLPRGVRIASFADGCRQSALDFINRVSVRADKAILVDWLRGSYHPHVLSLTPSGHPRAQDPAAVLPILPTALDKVLTATRHTLLRELDLARDPVEGIAFGYTALAAGFLHRCCDVDGQQGWIPVALPRMRLIDRVLSLIAADQLLRSEDYEKAMFSCTRCDALVFDTQRIEGRVCQLHGSDVHELIQGGNGRGAPRLVLVR
jgi:hypothetical protein